MKTKTMVMANLYISFFLLYALAIQGCSSARISQKETSASNPTVYIFKSKAEGFAKAFEDAYYKYHNRLNFDIDNIAYNGDGKNRIWPESAKALLAGEENRNDVWMVLSVDTSETYFSKNGEPLKYIMECKAHVVPIAADSIKVEIQVREAKVQTGTTKLPTAPHFVKDPIYKSVSPTTTDQYKILLCYGKALGVANKMPKLITN